VAVGWGVVAGAAVQAIISMAAKKSGTERWINVAGPLEVIWPAHSSGYAAPRWAVRQSQGLGKIWVTRTSLS
jgi:hypothetical protein